MHVHQMTYPLFNLPVPYFVVLTKIFKFYLIILTYLVSFLKVLLSNDIEINPGDFTNNFLSFCNWNMNSLAKDNFDRVHISDAHNS